MEKFDTVHNGYDKKQVNDFIDSIIIRVEEMVKEISLKDQAIKEYKKLLKDSESKIKEMSSKLQKEQNEDSKILDDAKEKSIQIIKEAEMQADLIISECLMEAKKSEIKLNYLNSEIERLKQMKETVYYN